jgi:hypothetical protein
MIDRSGNSPALLAIGLMLVLVGTNLFNVTPLQECAA